jgi:hypothetical protein
MALEGKNRVIGMTAVVRRSRSQTIKVALALLVSAGSMQACATSTAVPTPHPSPVAFPEPNSSPSAVAATKLEIRWRADDPVGVSAGSSIIGVARAGDAYVLVAEPPYRDEGSSEAAAWLSADGQTWEPTQEFPAGHRILAVTSGGPGFVAAGFAGSDAVVWTSADGRDWHPVRDVSLRNGVISSIVPTASGLIAFGHRPDSDAGAIWTSADGVAWLAATNETGLIVARGLQAVGSYDGTAIAFVARGPEGLTDVWETRGRAEWTRVGTLVDDTAMISQVAGGVRGWVALGSAVEAANLAWASSDGRSWSEAMSGPDVESDIIGDEAGFIAVGHVGSLPGETCGDQRPFAGHTWTSSDGRTWQRMPVTDEFRTAAVHKLLRVDRTLVGFGVRLPNDDSPEDMLVGRWTAPLPDRSRETGQSDEASAPESCGG